MPSTELQLRQVDAHLFTASLNGVEVARAKVAPGDGVWEVFSTVVQPEFEGQGIAAALVGFLLDSAETAGVAVVPSCWYVDRFMTRTSPRYDHLRVGAAAAGSAPGEACLIAPVVVGHDGDASAG